jgi:hypothetical protein
MRRLSDGKVKCMSHDTLRFQIAGQAALPLANKPGRFTEMTALELTNLHNRIRFKEPSNVYPA